jgi:hypothetical protein
MLKTCIYLLFSVQCLVFLANQMKVLSYDMIFDQVNLPYGNVEDEEDHLHTLVHELETIETRYYIYDIENITLSEGKENGKKIFVRKRPDYYTRHIQDFENDEQMLRALMNSSFRVYNPEEAQIFIAPIPFRIYVYKDISFQMPMEALSRQEPFQFHKGYNHVLISTCFALFKSEHRYRSDLSPYYDMLENVTVVQSWDPSAVYNDLQREGSDWKDYNFLRDQKPLTKRSVSVGLGMKNTDLELIQATVNKFYNASNFIFYHSRRKSSYYNSTIYRHAPITNITNKNFPKSSIGWDIEPEKWRYDIADSQFCLVVRGDSPHSHALWRAIRVGCIPVIASDTLPIFSPMFKHTLNMLDYSIILSEQELVNHPEETLLRLKNMTPGDIATKIRNLAFAQQVIFTDHPKSLFVPGLLKEVTMPSEIKVK